MLQVPCLSPPVYKHSHYKKFWLRQTEVKENVAGVGCEMMKSTSTSSPEAASSSKRICGKRRPSQVRSSLASPAELDRIKVPVNECLSPTSSGEIPAASGWKKSCYSRKNKRGSDGSSGVSSLDADVGAAAAAGSRSPEDDKSFITMSIDCNPPQELLQKQQSQLQATTTTQPEVMLVRHNRSSNESPISSAAASLDCLTSKCKSADSSLLRQDTSEESDSATSSTSQASDNDDARCRTSFRGHVKRRDPTKPAVVFKDEKCVASVAAGCISSSSPKTRQATAASSPLDSGGLRSPGHGSSPGGMNNVSRTCKHCGTMKTPLWRNGPLGPKSLCNACGIRLRKARRSSGNQDGQTTPTTTTTVPGKRKHNQQQQQQAEAGSGAAGSAATTTTTTTTTFLGGLPYKKSRVSFKREQGEQGFIAAKLSLLGSKSLSTDEEEGAVLLMALSCGLVLA